MLAQNKAMWTWCGDSGRLLRGQSLAVLYRCYIDVISVLYRCYIDVISVLYRCYIDVISVLYRCYMMLYDVISMLYDVISMLHDVNVICICNDLRTLSCS